MNLTEQQELGRRRREAVQKFIDDNAALFVTQDGELDFDDDEDPVDFSGPLVIENWVLLLCERNLGATEANHYAYSTLMPRDIGVHELIGLLEMARDRER